MANPIVLKNSNVQGKVPLTTDLIEGELAVNTHDGKVFTKKNVSGVESVIEIGGSSSVTLTGDVTGSGSGSFATTLANSGVIAGTYNNSATTVTSFTVDAKGRITATGTAVTIAPAFSSLTGTPTTLAGYGITDGVSQTSVPVFSGGAGGIEGGEIHLAKAPSSTTLTYDVIIDINDSRLRFIEAGGSFRGAYLDFTEAGAGVSSDLLRPSYANISGKPTTIAGYGITDAYTKAETLAAVVSGAELKSTQTLTPFLGNSFKSFDLKDNRALFASYSSNTIYIYAGTIGTNDQITLGTVATIAATGGSGYVTVRFSANSSTGYVVFNGSGPANYFRKITLDASNNITLGTDVNLNSTYGVSGSMAYSETLSSTLAVISNDNHYHTYLYFDGSGNLTNASQNYCINGPITRLDNISYLIYTGSAVRVYRYGGGTTWSQRISVGLSGYAQPPSWYSRNQDIFTLLDTSPSTTPRITDWYIPTIAAMGNVSSGYDGQSSYPTPSASYYHVGFGFDDKILPVSSCLVGGQSMSATVNVWYYPMSSLPNRNWTFVPSGGPVIGKVQLSYYNHVRLELTASAATKCGNISMNIVRKSDYNGKRYYILGDNNFPDNRVDVITYNG